MQTHQFVASALMRWQVTNLDIDGTIPAQRRLFKCVQNHIMLRQHEQSLRLWPSRPALDVVRHHVKALMSDESAKQIVFYGTGDLNHISSVLIENLPKPAKPLTVVLFDNHPDWFALPPRYHCGNWIANVLKLDWVESVILIGQTSDDMKGRDFWFSPFADLLSGRLRIFPYEKESVTVPFVRAKHNGANPSQGRAICRPGLINSELQFQSIDKLGIARLAKQLSDELQEKNVYIAIDKDVLRITDAQCDWEQGRMSLHDLLALLSSISDAANVTGADICGERSSQQLKSLIKQIDAGRLFTSTTNEVEFGTACMLNERANLAILEAITAVRKTKARTREVLCT